MDEVMAGFRRRLLDLEGQHDDRTMEKGQITLDYAVRLVFCLLSPPTNPYRILSKLFKKPTAICTK